MSANRYNTPCLTPSLAKPRWKPWFSSRMRWSERMPPISVCESSMHRIVVGYDLDLTPIGNDLELSFDLPEQIP